MKFLVFIFVVFSACQIEAEKTKMLFEPRLVVVLAEQRIYALEPVVVLETLSIGDQPASGKSAAWKIVHNFHVSTGKKGLATPVGKTKVVTKNRKGRALADLGGGVLEYQLRTPMYDAKQKKTRRIGIHAYDSVPEYPASHGCVRLATVSAKKLYQWATIGMPVEIVDKRPDWLPKT